MKRYHIGALYMIFCVASVSFIFWYYSTTDFSDCTYYLNSWNFSPESMKQLAYQECLETPPQERGEVTNFVTILIAIALLPSAIVVGVKSHKEWKKELQKRKEWT